MGHLVGKYMYERFLTMVWDLPLGWWVVLIWASTGGFFLRIYSLYSPASPSCFFSLNIVNMKALLMGFRIHYA